MIELRRAALAIIALQWDRSKSTGTLVIIENSVNKSSDDSGTPGMIVVSAIEHCKQQ